ncbi:MAG: hypothetical protein HYX51_11980 [Chloroflexi bacterium]|nr:hypothetical protein [Chloroflexota bacterium]
MNPDEPDVIEVDSGWPDGAVGQQRISRVRRRLLAWGRANFQRYDWRDEDDPWLTLAAEFFLQRTRARHAERVFREFRAEYPTAESLADAGPQASERVMEQLGIRWRAPLFHRLAEAIRERGGVPPNSLADLRAFTGVGPYTAAAWLSLHRGVRAVIVDSNVARLMSRLTGQEYPPDPRHVRWVNELADRLTPKRAFRDYNYAVLDFTMSVCTVRNPGCYRCPLRRDCTFGQERG